MEAMRFVLLGFMAATVAACNDTQRVVEAPTTVVCGNGIVELNEQCDDGNLSNIDDCLSSCVMATCGDGSLNLNGVTREVCDDGNTIDGDGCSASCESIERCGNLVVDPGEDCDDGNIVDGDKCSADCLLEACGNNALDFGEVCDDGNTLDGDGCNFDCKSGEGCRNAIIDVVLGEECDDGNESNNDACLTSPELPAAQQCKFNVCGDGVRNEDPTSVHFEPCDAAGESAECNLDCTPRHCGDGKINNVAVEQCDNLSLNADDRDCTSQCRFNFCGDGKRNTIGPARREQCDDGNTNNKDGCNVACQTPQCGNDIVDAGEQCDDGNRGNGDGCSGVCQYE